MSSTLGSAEALSTRWSATVHVICMGFAVMVKLVFAEPPTAKDVVELNCSCRSPEHTTVPEKSALPLFHIWMFTRSSPPASTSSAFEVNDNAMSGSGGGPTAN